MFFRRDRHDFRSDDDCRQQKLYVQAAALTCVCARVDCSRKKNVVLLYYYTQCSSFETARLNELEIFSVRPRCLDRRVKT